MTPTRRNREARVFRPRRLRTPVPLLATVLAVALPGLLLAGCSAPADTGQSREQAAVPAPATAAGSAAASARQAGSALAARLLTQAAQAAVSTSYQGQEVVSRWGASGESVLMSDIWHVSGGQTVTRTLAAGTASDGQTYTSSDTDGQWPEGVLGVTTPLVRLLQAHYTVAYAGPGSADNRKAQIVEAWRADGSLAARFWLDETTRLPLERVVFDSAAHVMSQEVFVDVRLGDQPSAPAASGPAGSPAPWAAQLQAGQLLALRSGGWLVPASLPGGLSLFTGAQTQATTGSVLDLGYSDGLSVVSLFEQHGTLPAELAGWQQVTLAGHAVYAAEPDQRSLTWASRGMVYTVMADAPSPTVARVVGALPHDSPPGFWQRMSRGAARVASWVNPFG
jgi:sigma-E factor negative regulatory protein RseB